MWRFAIFFLIMSIPNISYSSWILYDDFSSDKISESKWDLRGIDYGSVSAENGEMKIIFNSGNDDKTIKAYIPYQFLQNAQGIKFSGRIKKASGKIKIRSIAGWGFYEGKEFEIQYAIWNNDPNTYSNIEFSADTWDDATRSSDELLNAFFDQKTQFEKKYILSYIINENGTSATADGQGKVNFSFPQSISFSPQFLYIGVRSYDSYSSGTFFIDDVYLWIP